MANTHSIDFERDNSQYLSIADGDQTGLNLTIDFTIEAWVKIETLPSVAGARFGIVAKAAGGGDSSYALDLFDDDCLYLDFSDTGGGNAGDITRVKSTNPVIDGDDVGKWVHFAASVDISQGASGIILYKNGSPIADTDVFNNATTIYDGGSAFTINFGWAGEYLDGKIDDVRVWNDIRTAQEISDNYQKELVGDEANLVGYWKFNNSLLDETANNNDLTNNNGATFSTDVPFTEVVSRSFGQII